MEGVVIVGKVAIVLLFVGCAAATQTMGGARAAAPDDTFSCYVQVLAQMEYRVENTDPALNRRDSGFIVAVKEDGGLLGGEFANEATITIFPAQDGQGSDVSVTMRRSSVSSSGSRSTAGMTMTPAAQRDLESLSEACVS